MADNWLARRVNFKQEISPNSCNCWAVNMNDVTKALIGITRYTGMPDMFNIGTTVKTIVNIAKKQNCFTGLHPGFSDWGYSTNEGPVHALTSFCSLSKTALATGDTTTLRNFLHKKEAARSGRSGATLTLLHKEYQAFCHGCDNGRPLSGGSCVAPDHITARSSAGNVEDNAVFNDLRRAPTAATLLV